MAARLTGIRGPSGATRGGRQERGGLVHPNNNNGAPRRQDREGADICTHHGPEVACKKGVGPSGRSRHSSSDPDLIGPRVRCIVLLPVCRCRCRTTAALTYRARCPVVCAVGPAGVRYTVHVRDRLRARVCGPLGGEAGSWRRDRKHGRAQYE